MPNDQSSNKKKTITIINLTIKGLGFVLALAILPNHPLLNIAKRAWIIANTRTIITTPVPLIPVIKLYKKSIFSALPLVKLIYSFVCKHIGIFIHHTQRQFYE